MQNHAMFEFKLLHFCISFHCFLSVCRCVWCWKDTAANVTYHYCCPTCQETFPWGPGTWYICSLLYVVVSLEEAAVHCVVYGKSVLYCALAFHGQCVCTVCDRFWGCAVGFVDFTKLSFALSSLVQPFDQMGSFPEYIFVILSRSKAYSGRLQKETAGKRTGPMTKWPPRWLLFTRLEIVFVIISPFTTRTKVVPKVSQEGECCLEGLINLACGLQLKMRPRLNGHFINVLGWFCTYTKTTVSFSAILSCEILDFGQQFNLCRRYY